MIFKTFILTVFLLAVVQLSSAAFHVKECYQCEYFELYGSNATNNEVCKKNPPGEDFVVNCADQYRKEHPSGDVPSDWQCVKVTGRIEVDDENHNYYKRACSPGKNYDTCKDCKDTKTYETQYGFVKRGKHCVCDDNDNCNTANGLGISIVAVVVGLFVTAFSQV